MKDWNSLRNDGSTDRVKGDVKPRPHNLWQVKRITGSIANIFRNENTREVSRPPEMSRAEFFRRIAPGSSISELDLWARFNGWDLGQSVIEWRRI